MRLQQYQVDAYDFARFKYADYPFLALAEEVGEVQGKLAKYVRKSDTTLTNALQYPTTDLRDDLLMELGDVLWQLAACCTVLGVSLDTVAEMNLAKLHGRAARNTIVGEGDER